MNAPGAPGPVGKPGQSGASNWEGDSNWESWDRWKARNHRYLVFPRCYSVKSSDSNYRFVVGDDGKILPMRDLPSGPGPTGIAGNTNMPVHK